MRHPPFPIHRIPVKSAARLIVNSPIRHTIQRQRNHPPKSRFLAVRIGAKKKKKRSTRGKFRRTAPAAVFGVEVQLAGPHGTCEQVFLDRARGLRVYAFL